MCAKTSFSRSIPGASSVKHSPSRRNSNTARSGDVERPLARGEGPGAVVGDLLDLAATNLRTSPSLTICSRPSPMTTSRFFAVKVPQKTETLRVLRDVHEPADARGSTLPKRPDIHIALGIGLGQSEEGRVEPAAVVEVELRGLVDDRVRVEGDAEIQPARRRPADRAGLHGEREALPHPLLGRNATDVLRQADPEVDDVAGLDLLQARAQITRRSEKAMGSSADSGTTHSPLKPGL